MKYIKAKFVLPHPLSEGYDSYGWDTLWTKKAQILGEDAIEPGNIVNFQPVYVQANGKFLVLATERNLKAVRAMLAKKQITLAPGETLEAAPVVEAVKPKEDEWPAEPGAQPKEDAEEAELAEVAEEVVEVKKAARKTIPKPDME